VVRSPAIAAHGRDLELGRRISVRGRSVRSRNTRNRARRSRARGGDGRHLDFLETIVRARLSHCGRSRGGSACELNTFDGTRAHAFGADAVFLDLFDETALVHELLADALATKKVGARAVVLIRKLILVL